MAVQGEIIGFRPANFEEIQGFGAPSATPGLGSAAKPAEIASKVRAVALAKSGGDEDFAEFALRVAKQESNFNQAARGPVTRSGERAIGVMQLMPPTARDEGVDPTNLDDNIRGGVSYLHKQYREHGGDQSLAAASYNAGPGAVAKHGGVPPFAETREYVRKTADNAGTLGDAAPKKVHPRAGEIVGFRLLTPQQPAQAAAAGKQEYGYGEAAKKGLLAGKLFLDYAADSLAGWAGADQTETRRILRETVEEYTKLGSDPEFVRASELARERGGDTIMGTLAALPGAVAEAKDPLNLLGRFMTEQLIGSLPGFALGAVATVPVRAAVQQLVTKALVKKGINAAIAGAAGNGTAVLAQSLGTNYAEGVNQGLSHEAAKTRAWEKTKGEMPANVLAGAMMGLKVGNTLTNIVAQAAIQGAGGGMGAYQAAKAVGEKPDAVEIAWEAFGEGVSAVPEIGMVGIEAGREKLAGAPGAAAPPGAGPQPAQPSARPPPGGAPGAVLPAAEAAAPGAGAATPGEALAPAPPQGAAALQNRDRERTASVLQMQGIANLPDFDRLADAPIPDVGAPMVSVKGNVPGTLSALGRESVVTLPDGAKLPTRFALAEAGDILASHEADGSANPGYDAPAPGTVVALNNGRVAGLREAYRRGTADSYRAQLLARAGEFGLSIEQVLASKRPVLVRLFDDAATARPDLARQANAGGSMRLSALEQAKNDAAALPDLDGLHLTDDGDIDHGASNAFIRGFVGRLPREEQGLIADANGMLSQEGILRLRNAVLARAYGDSPTLQRMVESYANSARAATQGLMRAAPGVAQVRARMAEGISDPALDIAPNLVAALEEIAKLRARGQPLGAFLAQLSFYFEGGLAPETIALMRFLDANANAPKRIATFIQSYYEQVAQLGDPRQGELLGARSRPSAGELLGRALGGEGDERGGTGIQSGEGAPGAPEQALAPVAGVQGAAGEPGAVPPAEPGAIEPSSTPDAGPGAQDLVAKTMWKTRSRVSMPSPEGESPDLRPQRLGGNLPQGGLSIAPASSTIKAGATVSPAEKEPSDAVQVEGATQGVPREAGPELELRGVGEGNARHAQPAAEEGGAEAAAEKPAEEVAPGAPRLSAQEQARRDLNDALADLADIIGKPARLPIVPEQEQKLLPVLTRVFDAAFRLGYHKFKAAARFVRDTIREKLGREAADQLLIDHYQAAYIAMAHRYPNADSKRDVVAVESLEERLEEGAERETRAVPRATSEEGVAHTPEASGARPPTGVPSLAEDLRKLKAQREAERERLRRIIEERAHEAATSPKNDKPEPTPEQKVAAATTPLQAELEKLKARRREREPAAAPAVRFGQRPGLFELPPIPLTVAPDTEVSAKQIRDWALRKLRGEYRNADTGWQIIVARAGVEKATSQSTRIGDAHLQAIKVLPDLLERAVLAESHADRSADPNIVAIHRFIAPVQIGHDLYRAKLTVKEDRQGRRFYDESLTRLERQEVREPDAARTRGASPVSEAERSVQSSGSIASIEHGREAGNESAPLGTLQAPGTEAPGTPTLPTTKRIPTIADVLRAVEIAQLLRGARRDSDGKPFAPDPLQAQLRKLQAGKPSEAADEREPHETIAKRIAALLSTGAPVTARYLFEQADAAFGGTRAQGRYSVKDAYDALELGVNLYLAAHPSFAPEGSAAHAAEVLNRLRSLLLRLPTQTNRSLEQDEWQQFSTPPTYAWLANWVANIQRGETYLEPSAGVGGLAVFGQLAGARVVANELAPRRADLLAVLGIEASRENAEQLDNVLPAEVKPTVIVMNPPFSATAGRMQGSRDTMNGARHIEQALARLEPGGRLVAIVGEGMADERPAFRAWWSKIKREYNVRANIGIEGKGYAKYGTTFDNQLLVIDKTGPTAGTVLTAKVASPADAVALLEAIRNERRIQGAERAAGEPAGGGVAAPDRMGGERERPAPAGPDVVGTGGARPHQPRPADRGVGEHGRAPVEHAPAAGDALAGAAGEHPGRSTAGGGLAAGGGTAGAGRTGLAPAGERRLEPGSQLDIQAHAAEQAAAPMSDAIYEEYRPQRLRLAGAQPHPGKLVQSAAMASVLPPAPSYAPRLPKNLVESGTLSAAQLEAVVYAGQAHQQSNLDGTRRGFFIGDGTGTGKGREIAGIILDNAAQGRRKAVWVSAAAGLYRDAQRDYAALGGDKAALIDVSKVKATGVLKGEQGIAFLTYDTLKNAEKRQATDLDKRRAKTRVDQLVEWLGEDFDGVLVFDESHKMGNAIEMKAARGFKKPSGRALAGIKLQKRLPNARVVYVSATGATEVHNLGYANRLGLWGQGTAFSGVREFISAIETGGLAALELVARDMKAQGVYLARSLSYDGVTYSRLEHPLSEFQTEVYNELARAWQGVLMRLDEALGITNQNLDWRAKAAAKSAFWGAQQRFFNQVLTSMQMPSVIEQVQRDLAAGHAVVMQLVNTNEAAQARALEGMEEGESLEELDLTPREQLIQYVRNSFPVQAFETYFDEDGNQRARPVVDAKGNPVFDKEAIALRDQLIANLEQIRVPAGPLEMLFDAFGPEVVAEVTGRGERIVRVKDKEGNEQKAVEKRGKSAAAADADAFQADKKRILIFSDAGGTGFSFHADRTAANRRRRMHYLLQPGWRADNAVQGFGRTHRTNQESAPHYYLATTSLPAQKRFVSSIARRLDQLGALTKGQRQTGSQGLFDARDNLESGYARSAVYQLFKDLYAGKVPDMDWASTARQLGFDPASFIDKNGNFLDKKIPQVPQLLNRLLSLTTEMQDRVFEQFSKRLDANVEAAIRAGTLDMGWRRFAPSRPAS